MTEIARQRTLRLLWTVLLVASLAAVVALNRPAASERAADPAPSNAIARYGFQLEEGAARAGAAFVHQGPTFDRRLDHIGNDHMGAFGSVAPRDGATYS